MLGFRYIIIIIIIIACERNIEERERNLLSPIFFSRVWCVKEGRTIIKTIDSNVNGSLFLCPHERKKMWKDSCVHDGMRRMTTKGKIIDTHCQRDIWRRAINGSSHWKQHF